MATSIKSLLIKIGLIGDKETKGKLSGLEKALGNVKKQILATGAAYFGAKGIINGIQKSLELAGQSEKLSIAFNNLSKSAGFSSSTLNKLRTATDGTIGSMELMEQANNAMLLGIVDSEEQMADMFDIAQRLASSLGKDTRFGVESLTTGLGRQSKLMLDNLGIMVDTNKAYENYANELGKTVEKLTDAEKKQAFINATLDEGRKLVNQLGEEQLTYSDRVAQASVLVEELSIKLGEAFLPALESVLPALTQFTTQLKIAFAPELTTIDELGVKIKDLQAELFAVQEGNVGKKFLADLFGRDEEAILKEIEALTALRSALADQQHEEKKLAETKKELVETDEKFVNNSKALYEEIFPRVREEADLYNTELAEIPVFLGAASSKTKDFETIATSAFFASGKAAGGIGDALSATGELASALAGEDKKRQIAAMRIMQAAALAYALQGSVAAFKSGDLISGAITAAGIQLKAAAEIALIEGQIQQVQSIQAAAFGADQVVNKPTLFLTGEAGPEQVSVTPLTPGMNKNGPQGGVTINIQGNMIGNESFVRDTLIPEISKATQRGLA